MGIKLTPSEKISRAIIDLQEKNPFFAHLTFGLKFGASEKCPTMLVNSRGECLYNEKWVDGLKREELHGVLCHEVLHVALDHLSRIGARRRKVANVAMDIAVNHIVKTNQLGLPKGVIQVDTHRDNCVLNLQSKKGKKKVVIGDISKRFWEDMYGQLAKEIDDDEGWGGGGDGEGGEGGRGSGEGDGEGDGYGPLEGDYSDSDGHSFGEDDGLTDEERRQNEEKWRARISEGVVIAKQRGKIPGGMDRYIDDLLKPRVRWKDMLRSMIKPYITPVDYSYRKPHKKSVVTGVFLPAVRKEHMEVEVLVDTSGSIGQEELKEFLSEVVGIATASNHVKMWVSFCDTTIGSRYEVSNGNIATILAMKPTGGGGTEMENGLDEIKKRNPRVPVVVVLTDGWDGYHRRRSDYPFEVIWCLAEHGKSIEEHTQMCAYGQRVKIAG